MVTHNSKSDLPLVTFNYIVKFQSNQVYVETAVEIREIGSRHNVHIPAGNKYT